MQKNFQKWHQKKEAINNISKPPFFHERDIWFCHLGVNVGFEQDGRGDDFLRPVVIIRKFNNQIFWTVPLTKAGRKINRKTEKYYFSFSFISNVQSVAILSQIRLIDAKRLGRHIGVMAEDQFRELTKKLKALMP